MYADDTTHYFNLEDIDSVDMNDNINTHLEKNMFGLNYINWPLTLAMSTII